MGSLFTRVVWIPSFWRSSFHVETELPQALVSTKEYADFVPKLNDRTYSQAGCQLAYVMKRQSMDDGWEEPDHPGFVEPDGQWGRQNLALPCLKPNPNLVDYHLSLHAMRGELMGITVPLASMVTVAPTVVTFPVDAADGASDGDAANGSADGADHGDSSDGDAANGAADGDADGTDQGDSSDGDHEEGTDRDALDDYYPEDDDDEDEVVDEEGDSEDDEYGIVL